MLPVTLSSFTSTSERQHLPKLKKSKIKLIEDSTVLAIEEKVEILMLFLHKKWIAEIDIGLKRSEASIALLEQLELSWYIESYEGAHKEQWIQVGANQAVLDYVSTRRAELSDLESGVLYGFPLSHVLGYVGIIQRQLARPTHVSLYMLAGVYSKDFQAEEVRYFEEVWNEVKKISPVIAEQSRKVYESYEANT
jgi:hypothetical protein